MENSNNDIATTMALREKKSHLLETEKFYQSIKDKKQMLVYVKKIKELDSLEEDNGTVGKDKVGESVIKLECTVGKSIELEKDVVVIYNNKK